MGATQVDGTGRSSEFAQKNTHTPSAATDIANKAYVDAVAQGLSPKTSVVVATAAVIAANTYANGASGVGATITFTAAGAQTVDGVVPALGERILVKDETAGNALKNGIYVVTVKGTGIVQEVWTRALDCNEATDFPGAFVFTESGTVNTGAGFVCTNTAPVVVGTTAITWTQFSGLGQITAGAGLTKTGNTLNVGAGDGIQADADSVTVKLDGATLTKGAAGLKTTDGTFVKADGTVAFSGSQSMGGQILTNLGTPASASDAASVLSSRVASFAFWYGGGIDSTLTLVANTALASGSFSRQYTNVDLAGFTLTQNSADIFLLLFISGTLTMGGGTITNAWVGTAGGGGGNGDTGHPNSGYGGAGAANVTAVYVYAKIISGSGTIHCRGTTGTVGQNGLGGGSAPSGQVNGGTGTNANGSAANVHSVSITVTTAPQGGGGGNGAGTTGGAAGAGGTGPTAAGASDFRNFFRDFHALLFGIVNVAANNVNGQRVFATSPGAGGGGGGGNTNFGRGGGGGGGGGGGFINGQTGGNGGAGGNSAGAGAAGMGGGGGGGGSSGGICIVITSSAAAGLTISTSGGTGGAGGNATAASGGGGGGPGGGGAGGYTVYIGPSGPSVDAAAGAAGAVGTGAAGGANGSAGTAGSVGVVYQMNT